MLKTYKCGENATMDTMCGMYYGGDMDIVPKAEVNSKRNIEGRLNLPMRKFCFSLGMSTPKKSGKTMM